MAGPQVRPRLLQVLMVPLKITFAFCSPSDNMALEMAEPGSGTKC
jgi:hypothetical protein